VLSLRQKGPSSQPAQRGWVIPKKLDFPGHSPPGYEERYQERKTSHQKNDRNKRTSALHSRYESLKETHESEGKGHEDDSSSETGTEKYQNVPETEKRKRYFCKAENALNVPYRYQASTNCNSTEKSCMTGCASEKIKLPTIADYGMEGDESLHVAHLPTCEDHDLIIENVSSKGVDIKKESERESNRFSVLAKDGEVRRPPVLTSLNDTKHRYGLNRLLGIPVLLSGRKVTALVDSGCEAELIISRRFAQGHGIAAAETARSCSGIALPDETILEATETDSLELDAGGVKSTCRSLVIEISAYDCVVGRPWLEKHNPLIDWRKNRLMIAKNGRRYDLDARKDPCVGKGKHVKLHLAKQLCRMVKGKYRTVLVTLQAIEKNSAPRNGILSKRWESLLENYKTVFPDEQPGYPPKRSVELGINVEEGTESLSKPAYRLSPAELDELKSRSHCY
jgi:hypothetical protein